MSQKFGATQKASLQKLYADGETGGKIATSRLVEQKSLATFTLMVSKHWALFLGLPGNIHHPSTIYKHSDMTGLVLDQDELRL